MPKSSHQGYYGRVRTGCLTCRSRKVKCDEARPVCNNCTRVKRQCLYKSSNVPASASSNDRSPPGRLSHRTGSNHSTGTDDSTQLHSSSSSTSSSQSRGTIRGLSSPIVDQTPVLYQGSTSIDLTSYVAKALEDRIVAPASDPNHHESNSSLSLISRDIEITTIIDILTLRTQSPSMTEVFLEAVDCPGITPFDPVNWRSAKHCFVKLGQSCTAISSCITAISVLHNGQVYGLSSSRAVAQYQSARKSTEELLSEANADFELVLVAVFLICVFELLYYGDLTPFLKQPSSRFIAKTLSWSQDPASHSPLAKRLITWLKIIHSITCRGGAMGLVSDQVARSFPNYIEPLPIVKAPTCQDVDSPDHVYELLSSPIFGFYFQLQIISGQIARLSLYHRSRTKATDQQEVAERMASLKSQLHQLWESRCATLRQSPKNLRSESTSHTAKIIIDLIGICEAAYYAELVDIGRQLGDPLSKSRDSQEALHRIREIVENDACNGHDREGYINPAYLRPLFLYAIESMDSGQSQWAIDMIAEIRNPIYRGGFFSQFAKALAEAQVRNDRRVNSRYFCIWYFGVTPPFL